MMRRVAIIGHPLAFQELSHAAFGIFDRKHQRQFSQHLTECIGLPYCFLMNSGIASFYVILNTFKKLSSRNEVLLPAYTAPSLVAAIFKAKLKPILYDISLSDFNADIDAMLTRVNKNTLCVLGVHMFGIPWEKVAEVKRAVGEDVYVVEDCAQAFGAKINAVAVGRFSDAAFYSFNRGKNLPTYDGGCIMTHSETLAFKLEEEIALIASPGFFMRISLALKLIALYASFKPYVYTLAHPVIAHFKDNSVPEDFKVLRYSSFQASLGDSLLKSSSQSFSKRYTNGRKLIDLLKGIQGIALPALSENSSPVFNRLPVVFKEPKTVDMVIQELGRAGIESSRLYFRPLHHIFDLGYKKDDFPNAVYFAHRLLTLPVHPLVTQKDIEKIADVVKSCLWGRGEPVCSPE